MKTVQVKAGPQDAPVGETSAPSCRSSTVLGGVELMAELEHRNHVCAIKSHYSKL